MAKRLDTGAIEMDDGRIIYADSVILGQDVPELVRLLTPPPHFVGFTGRGGAAGSASSGGGSGGSGSGSGGIGPGGFPGPSGSTGVDGDDGNQGNQGVVGLGVQGPQGFQAPQGNQGVSGPGVQGPQGNQGDEGEQGDVGDEIQGPQGNQGLAGSGVQGPQGNQGNQGVEGSTTSQIASGTYTGDGAASQTITTGLTIPPKMVFVHVIGPTSNIVAPVAIFKPTLLAGSDTAFIQPSGTLIQAIAVISISGNNFNALLGSGQKSANNTGTTYHWVAIG